MDMKSLNKGVPWRGAQEKDSKSIKLFIEAVIKLGVVVLGAYASTSNDNHGFAFIIFDCMCLNLAQFAYWWFSLWFPEVSIHACK